MNKAKLGNIGGVTFSINGKEFRVNPNNGNVTHETRLVDFIRDEAGLKGTKWTCREGGCGACVVSAVTKDPKTGDVSIRSVNSCLTPVLSCDGWSVSTVEDLGNKRDGYHPIQRRLAQFGGTQCGYCSPGMVMNMYSLAEGKKDFNVEDVENAFDGNICRCTGYRSIMDAFKSFANDADPDLKQKAIDIEDFCKTCPALKGSAHSSTNGASNGSGNGCCQSNGGCMRVPDLPAKSNIDLFLPSGVKWTSPTELKTLFETLNNYAKNNLKYRIVAGNTGTGVYKSDGPYDAYIEVNNVPELSVATTSKAEVVLGGALTLTKMIEHLEKVSKITGYEYAADMSKHIRRVANTPVRNFGTIAGNLMMKHAHNEFPSDIFLLLETVGAKVFVAGSTTDIRPYSPADFLKVNMNGKLIVYVTLPLRDGHYFFRSFKITKRYQNSHAYVNAGFLFKVDPTQNFRVLEKPTICYGGIHPEFVHATKTEELLTGAELGNQAVVAKAIQSLEQELNPDHHLPDASPEYRKKLAQGLLYKVFLGILGNNVKGELRSGAEDIPRKKQSGKQYVDKMNENEDSPLYKPIPKIEGLAQCSGEAEYVNDIPRQFNEVFGAFVYSTVANVTLKNLDASEALDMPGVITFLTAKDVPGVNTFYEGMFVPGREEIFKSNEIQASGQAVGLIVAENMETAFAAAKLVKVEYDNYQPVVTTIRDAVEKSKREGNFEKLFGPMVLKSSQEPNTSSKHRISGKFEIGSQAHIHMENHVTLALPKEDSMMIYCATQFMDLTQSMVAKALGMQNNQIDVQVRRLGGGYGGKITRQNQVATAAAVAAYVLQRPVRVALDLESGLEMMGKRLPYYVEYEAGFDDSGKIDFLNTNLICDAGWSMTDSTSLFAALFFQNGYAANGWTVKAGTANTHTHANTPCRAPGTTQGIAAIENIMEHIADFLKADPVSVREANFIKEGDEQLMGIMEGGGLKFSGENLLPTVIAEMKKIADYDARKAEIATFNKNNRWRKRGLALVPMLYNQGHHGFQYSSFVAVHSQDGTVSVSHGGIEMGQGLNTKVAQVVSNELGVPLSKISIKPSNNVVSANNMCTGGAIGSELVAHATMKACQELKARMLPLKKGNDLSWEELVQACYRAGLDLRSTYLYSTRDEDVKPYQIYGCNLTEVEVDILTGEYKISRLDLIEDAGKSLSPDVDLGQIEGSTVMGLGLWTEEKIVFHPETGRLLTKNTWEYKVPFPKSIPEDFRVTFMRNSSNPYGVLRSKATGEPPLCMAVAVLFAIKNAIKAARQDAGNNEWFQLNGPVTPEDVVRLSLADPTKDFVY